MHSGGKKFKDGKYMFYFKCCGLIWKYTAQERLELKEKEFPVCPKCGAYETKMGELRYKKK